MLSRGYYGLRQPKRQILTQSVDSRCSSEASHALLQIHRIAVEQVTGQKFKGTLASVPLVIGKRGRPAWLRSQDRVRDFCRWD